MWLYLGILVVTLLISFLGGMLVRFVAQQKGWVAHPSPDRWHQTPTALHGGVSIFVSFATGLLLLMLGFRAGLIRIDISESYGDIHFQYTILTILLGVVIIFLVGLVDDFVHLKPGVKLLGELLAVSIVIFFGVSFHLTPFPWVDILLSYLWFIGIVNAVNLLDNMDGVSSGVVIIGAIGVGLLGIFGYRDYPPASVFIAGILVFAAFGFWLHNKPPAKLFMGDSGSLVLGFVFAAITIPSELNAFYIPDVDFSVWDKLLQLLTAITLAAIPILDTTLVTITRLMRGQSPSVGGKDHSTHRLAQSGLTHWQTLKILYSVGAICAFVAVIMVVYPQFAFFVFGTAFLSMTIVAVYLASVRIQVAPIKQEGWQQLITSIAYRLPLIKMVMDVVLIALSFHLAYLIRFDFKLESGLTLAMIESMPIVIIGCLISNFILRIYDFSWRSASSRDILNYAGTSGLGTILSLALVTLATSFGLGYSRGAFVLFAILYFVALTASRFSYRFIDDILLRIRLRQTDEGKIPLILYGTGRNAMPLFDEIIHDTEQWSKYQVVGIVDTSRGSAGKRLQGVSIKSESEWLNENHESQPEILLIDESVDSKTVRAFADQIGKNLRVRKFVRKILEIS